MGREASEDTDLVLDPPYARSRLNPAGLGPTRLPEKDMPCTPSIVALAASGLFVSATAAVTAETITVCASGCDHTSINAAIDAASDGDVIQLSDETYHEGEAIDTDGKAITLRGVADEKGGPASILDGGDSHGVLECRSNEGPETIFENLMIRNGSAALGGGMLNDGASPTLANCAFMNNSSSSYGGGMFNSESSVALFECTFAGNSAVLYGGGMFNANGSPALDRCTFTSNTATYSGGAIYSSSTSAPILAECRLWCNEPLSIGGSYEEMGCNCIRDDCVECPADAPDADDDGVCDESDICPGGDDTMDADEDGTPDDCDGCPNDPFKTAPGSCGCGVVDTNVNGDVDCDGDYDQDDALAAMEDFGITGGVPGDLDGDGDVDPVDWELLGDELGVCRGDINGDGKVDAGDLGLLIAAWGACP